MASVIPLTPVAKILIIISVSVWFIGQVILEQYVLPQPFVSAWLSLSPISFLRDYFIWQPLTYLFVSDLSVFTFIFNLLLIWWLGSELERFWGSRFFATYFLVCGVVAAILYSGCALIYSILTTQAQLLTYPLMGPQASLFGLMVAYAMIFGERIVYFMFLFPMRAKYFVLILAAIEILMVLNRGSGYGRMTSFSHILGLVVGFIFLKLLPFIQNRALVRKKKSQKLKLVVNNETDFNKDNKPKYWN
ncbi:MAG: rhomboid family intramembrane serine protease [Oligoflexia bacterium]|nr:rhomboid family intramembrane serine protease [Oligoflexia bacterium]